jgi:hypothetical protein
MNMRVEVSGELEADDRGETGDIETTRGDIG